MSEWTPGKWLVMGQTVYALDEQEKANRFSTHMQGGYVNSGSRHAFGDAIVRTDDAELAANAHLIAAAPDLYEALKRADEVLTWLDENCPDCFGWTGPYPSKSSAVGAEAKLARAALAKARGEAQ